MYQGNDGRSTLPAKITVWIFRPSGRCGRADAARYVPKLCATRSIRAPSGADRTSCTKNFRNCRATSQRSGGIRKASDEKKPYRYMRTVTPGSAASSSFFELVLPVAVGADSVHRDDEMIRVRHASSLSALVSRVRPGSDRPTAATWLASDGDARSCVVNKPEGVGAENRSYFGSICVFPFRYPNAILNDP